MRPDSLLWSMVQVGGILFLATVVARIVVSVLLPEGRDWRLERWGWSVALASLLVAASVVVSFAVGLRPGWAALLVVSIGTIVGTRRFRLPRLDRTGDGKALRSPLALFLLALAAAGVLIYVVRSLSEPMWSNDFLAVWGLKGKTMFGDAAIPQRLFRWAEFEFSNPSYPIGLPLAYAGVAFLLGRWDDHAMALLFPFLQLGTLLVLLGWLRRRGTGRVVSLAAVAFVANFGVLYSAWLTGMAEVPAAFAFLLLGTSLWDVLDRTDPGSLRRLFLASLLAAATKNEGVFLVATVAAFLAFQAIRRGERRLWPGVAAAAAAGLGCVILHRLLLGSHPERAFDIGLLWRPGLGSRLATTLREEWARLARPIWPGIAAVLVLAGLPPRRLFANPILVVASVSVATYLALPALSPYGPAFLVQWTVGRVCAALVPLLAAGVGMAWRNSDRAATQAFRIDVSARP